MNAKFDATQIAEAYRRVDAVARTLHHHLESERAPDVWDRLAEAMFRDLDEAIAEVDRLETSHTGASA